MRLSSNSFEDGDRIPARYAFAEHHPETRVTLAGNVNPHLAWDDVPDATKSFVLICHDYSVPSAGDDVNQPDREVPPDLPRVDFFHWIEIDLPSNVRAIEEGEFCEGVTIGGKPFGLGPHGSRTGVNDFTGWFAGDSDMEGTYHGYDGPAPPWNDSLMHHYQFTVFALDVDSLDLEASFTGLDVRQAMAGHVLAEASIEGTYTQNPRLL